MEFEFEFEFDPAKSASNKAKHGIDFVEAQALWLDYGLIEAMSKADLSSESRFLAIGKIEGRLWTAICTRRGQSIRIISVRRARKEEIVLYEDA